MAESVRTADRWAARRRWVVAAGIVAALAAGVPGVPATNAAPPGKIALMTSDADGATRIHVVDATGANRRRVAIGTQPRWSPDGSRLAFNDGFNIAVVAADGTGKVLAVPLAFDAQWSRDGSRIAHVALRPRPGVAVYFGPPFVFPSVDFDFDIAVVRLADGLVTPLTAGPYTDLYPTWSPHGSRVAFTRYTLPTVPLLGRGSAESVASSGGVPSEFASTLYVTGPVRWAPNGSTIAASARSGGVDGVWTVDFVRGGAPVLLHETYLGISSLHWSPDGRWVAFAGGFQNHGGNDGVHVLAIDGSSHHHFPGRDPTFSPDGMHVAYCDDTGLWRAERDGSAAVRLVQTQSCYEPDWGR